MQNYFISFTQDNESGKPNHIRLFDYSISMCFSDFDGKRRAYYRIRNDYTNGDLTLDDYKNDNSLFETKRMNYYLEKDENGHYIAVEKTEEEILANALRKEKLELLEKNYNKARALNIIYGNMEIQLSPEKKEYDHFVNLIKNAVQFKGDESQEKQKKTFFFHHNNKQYTCVCYNWVWAYVFEEFIEYLAFLKQKKEALICDINKANLETLQDGIFNLSLDFLNQNGLFLSISDTIDFIKNNSNDGDIVIPQYVKDAQNIDNDIFLVATNFDILENIKQTVQNKLSKSFFYTNETN